MGLGDKKNNTKKNQLHDDSAFVDGSTSSSPASPKEPLGRYLLKPSNTTWGARPNSVWTQGGKSPLRNEILPTSPRDAHNSTSSSQKRGPEPDRRGHGIDEDRSSKRRSVADDGSWRPDGVGDAIQPLDVYEEKPTEDVWQEVRRTTRNGTQNPLEDLGTGTQRTARSQFNQTQNTYVSTRPGPEKHQYPRYQKRDFREGDIVWANHYVCCFTVEAEANKEDTCIRTRNHGYVNCKRRPMIILWRHDRDMFVAPLHT